MLQMVGGVCADFSPCLQDEIQCTVNASRGLHGTFSRYNSLASSRLAEGLQLIC